MSRRYFNCRLKATLSPWCENSSWNRVKYEGTWRLANNLPGSGISNFKFADLNFSSGERFRSFSDASRSNVLLQRATNLLFFPRMDNHFCFFFIILDVNFNFEVKKNCRFFYFIYFNAALFFRFLSCLEWRKYINVISIHCDNILFI